MKLSKQQNKNIPNNEDVFVNPLSQNRVPLPDNHFYISTLNLFVKSPLLQKSSGVSTIDNHRYNNSISDFFVNPIKILGVKINILSTEKVLQKIPDFLNSKIPHRIATVNAEYILEAQKDGEFKNIINSADLSVADGIGVIWAAKFLSLKTASSRLLRVPQIVVQYVYTGALLVFWPSYCRSIIRERVSGVDLIEKILETKKPAQNAAHDKAGRQRNKEIVGIGCANPRTDNNIKIFLLGGYDSIGEKIKKKYSDVVVGSFEGSPNQEDDARAREAINSAQANILFVAYGNPASKQEKWISRNLPHLPSVRLAMGIGGSFDFLAGRIRRAPRFMQYLGIEWVYRVIREPKRIFRIYNAVIIFSMQALVFKLKQEKKEIEKLRN